MELLSPTDVFSITVATLLVGLHYIYVVLRSKGKSTAGSSLPIKPASPAPRRLASTVAKTRSIRKLLDDSGSQCMLFHGSETGTATRLATQFAQEATSRYGVQCTVADLGDCDYDDLANLRPSQLVVFFVATTGDGEPTTNTMSFAKFLSTGSSATALQSLQYAVFGLGSSSYALFNQAAKSVDAGLALAGAKRLGKVGLADDGRGTTEDDYIIWVSEVMPLVADALHLEEKPYSYTPNLSVREHKESPCLPLRDGEPNFAQSYGRVKGPFTVANPYPARLKRVARLTSPTSDRQCLHMEFDVSESSITYVTGDHLSVLPTNDEDEVQRFLRVFGLEAQGDDLIEVTSKDPAIASPLPGIVTYRAAVRKYLNICGPVTRNLLMILSLMTTDQSAQNYVLALAQDAERFHQEVKTPHLNLAQLLETRTCYGAWTSVDFAVLMENLGPLKPRYYSISSSSVVSNKSISITVVEDVKKHETHSHTFKGVCTSYLAALSSDKPLPARVLGPRNAFTEPTAYVSVKRSKFRLPNNSETPIIMIGPGTGVAPFRGFVEERAQHSRMGKRVGKTVLFFGCRNAHQDFLCREDWQEISKDYAPGAFAMHVAFSRMPDVEKRYVQQDIREHAAELRELILEQGAHVYICGNASTMAKDVTAVMKSVVLYGDSLAGSMVSPDDYVKMMKSKKRWLEDVW